MSCRLMSSTKTPCPWTSRLSSLRGTLCPAQRSSGAATSTCSGATVVSLIAASSDAALTASTMFQ